MPRAGSALGWFTAPATDEAPRYAGVGLTVLRIVVGLMWLYNIAWKRAPNFSACFFMSAINWVPSMPSGKPG